jgi:hypothetical protein
MPIHEGFGESGRPYQRVDHEWKPPQLRDAIRVVHSIKSNQRLRPVQVLQDRWAYDIDYPASKFELMLGLVGGRSTVD